MITTAIIAFRESFEMFLVIVPLILYLSKINRIDLRKYIYYGTVTGVVLSIGCSVFLFGQAKTLDVSLQHIFQGTMMLFLSALILYSIVLLKKQGQVFTTKIDENFTIKTRAFSLFILAFLTIFRESLEITIFTLPFINEAVHSIVVGIILGILASTVVMFVVYKTTIRLSVDMIFNALTIILILIGAMLFGEGMAELIPSLGASIEKCGQLIYAIPAFYIFLKSMIKKYVKKL